MRKNNVVVLDPRVMMSITFFLAVLAVSVENDGLDDKLVEESKGKLKTAFAKSNKGRIQSQCFSTNLLWWHSVA